MKDEILKEYEKVKDKISQEQFLAEMNEIIKENEKIDFYTDLDAALAVVENHNGVETTLFSQTELASDETTQDEDTESTEISSELEERYNKVKHLISKEEFLTEFNEIKSQYDDVSIMSDSSIADMVVGKYIDEKNELVSEREEYVTDTIDKLEDGNRDKTISGRIMLISNPKSFTTRKGKKGQVCNMEIADKTGKIRVVLWTESIKLLKNFTEGDIVQITKVDIKDGFSGLEATMKARSNIIHIKDPNLDDYPVFEEKITNIADIEPDTKVNIIARIVRIPTIRTYEKDGKDGKVVSLELQDATGKISYTLWNRNTELIESLDLHDGDTVKITAANARERNDELSLTHWDGRIIPGDYDVPELDQTISKVADLDDENNDVCILGIVSRVQDIRTFIRKNDGSEGKLRNFDIMDDTGSIRVTLWGDDTDIPINKGDIVKLIGGNVRYDEYAANGYSINTNFNTQLSVNPDNLSVETLDQLDLLKENIGTMNLEDVIAFDDDGHEVDVVGWILSLSDTREFTRESDGSTARVRSADFSDGTGKVQVSFWDEKTEFDYKVGDAYQIENARTRWGYDNFQLNVGNTSRVIKLTEEQSAFLTSFETVESMVYTHKQIADIEDEDETDIIIIGRIFEVSDIREFDRDDGTTGFVRNMEIADNSGSIRVVLWNEDAKREFNEGDPIKLQNPRINYNDNHLELTVGSTTLVELSESELNSLPSFEELKDAIYVPKSIEAIEDDDRNILVTGQLTNIVSNRLITTTCPNCNNTINGLDGEDETICDYCGNVIDKVNYRLMIPTTLQDDTGEISVTFFGKLVEELLEMSQEEIVKLYEDSAEDTGVFEGKVQELEGLTVEIIGNVRFDEFNEEIRLNPSKIISKYY